MKFRSQISLLKLLALAASMLWLCTAIAGGKPIKVTAANPNSALQGDELNVVIDGSGFGHGSIVKFLVTGSDDSFQIIVDQDSVESNARGTQLSVSIVVLSTALEVDYDIEVSLGGRRGKGTTLFSVGKVKGGNDWTTGCLVYRDNNEESEVDEIQSDGAPLYPEPDPYMYCHDTDGQISIPTILRHDLKKFNGNGRTIIVDPVCHDNGDDPIGSLCFNKPAEARILQSRGRGDSAGNYAQDDLKFLTMGYQDVARVSLDFDLSRQWHIYFGNGTFVNDATQTCGLNPENKAGPAWVRCEAHDGSTCTEWTISTDDLRSDADAVNPIWPDDARACLVRYKAGTQVLDGDVEADFEIYLIAN